MPFEPEGRKPFENGVDQRDFEDGIARQFEETR